MKVFVMNHQHLNGSDAIVFLAESEPDVIDLVLYDCTTYEPCREDEYIEIDSAPTWVEEFMAMKALRTQALRDPGRFPVVPLASSEERREFMEDLDEYSIEMINRFSLRD